jgi:putative DNA primase/helicase
MAVDSELLHAASEAANGDKFRCLWAGDITAYDSASEADLAIANLLAFWTGPDPARIESLMRQSGLKRPKWDRHRTYLADTIKKALEGKTEFYGSDAGSRTKAEAQTRQQTIEAFPLTDTGLAERFALQHGDDVRFCFAWGKWLVWDNTRWKIDDGGTVEQLGKRTVRSIFGEAADEPDDARRKALAAFAKSSESATKRSAMLTLARSEPPIPITPDALDKDPWIFNCPNGKLDLHTAQLCEHRHEDYVTKLCPVEYHPNALCPTWLAALDRIFSGDSELIDFLQRFVGHSLTGDVSEQVLSIWHGVGANGKSTVANTIMEMLGPDYSMKAPADLLLQKRDSEHPTALTDLHGKRFVACIETDDGRRLAESLVKELTGGDPIRARRMREDFWQFWPTHKVVLACNHRPTVRGTDHAIWRRLKLVPFNVVIPPAERDKDLPAKLREELPGILAWAVRGCLDWQRHGLGEPKAVIDATAGYQTAEDTLLNFITDCCVMGPENRVKAADLLDAYRTWSGDKYMTVRKLTAMLTERGVERHKSNGLWYRGLGLLTSGTTKQRNDFTP